MFNPLTYYVVTLSFPSSYHHSMGPRLHVARFAVARFSEEGEEGRKEIKKKEGRKEGET